jgi:hypothetical protein
MKINIITPCTRPNNLFLLFQSIIKGVTSTDDITWYIIYDGGKITEEQCFDFTKLKVPSYLNIFTKIFEDSCSVFGNSQRNQALNQISDGWVYFLDDDNVLHPKLFSTIKEQLKIEKKSVFIFNQFFNFQKKRIRHAAIDKIKEGYIDTAQFLINYSIIRYRRWKKEVFNADGSFIREILELHRNEFRILNSTLAYYNGANDKTIKDALGIKELIA